MVKNLAKKEKTNCKKKVVGQYVRKKMNLFNSNCIKNLIRLDDTMMHMENE